MLFQSIQGQDHFKKQLIRIYKEQKIPHALLLLNREGGTGLALGLAFARFLHCEDKQAEDSCGKCSSCKKYDKLIHPDLNFVYPVAGNDKISKPLSRDYLPAWRKMLLELPFPEIRDWMEAMDTQNKQALIPVEESRQIIQNLSLKSFEGNEKIVLIWLPENMNPQAANALLKVLEEPPPQSIFLMVCENIEKLLLTILSRVRVLQVPGLSDEETEGNLVHFFGLDKVKARELAGMADGNLNFAIKIYKNPSEKDLFWFRDWMRLCYKKETAALIKMAEEFGNLEKEIQKKYLYYGLCVCRDALVLLNGDQKTLKLYGEKLDFVWGFARTLQPGLTGILYHTLNELYLHLERNANARIAFMDASLLLSEQLFGMK